MLDKKHESSLVGYYRDTSLRFRRSALWQSRTTDGCVFLFFKNNKRGEGVAFSKVFDLWSRRLGTL